MLEPINQFITLHHLISENTTVVLGLSGGPDSVYLLHLLAPLHKQKKISLIAAHLDHQWRADSAHDVEFCKKSTQELGIPFVHAQASEVDIEIKKNGSQEEVGRKLRRAFLESVAHKYNAQAIALAHHAQDQEETFLIRLIRGTTLTGLIGMKPQQGLYIRPLLETNKADILAYLDQHKIAYLTDPTNASESYLRNRIRARVLPALHEVDNRFDANFIRTLNHLEQAEEYLEQETRKIFSKISVDGGLRTADLLKLDPYMQKRILIHWLICNKAHFVPTDSFLNEILRFLESQKNGAHTIHTSWEMLVDLGIAYIKKF